MSTEGPRPAPSRRYATLVGIAFLALIAIAILNTIRTGSGGTLGVTRADRGMPLPEFAVPNARTGPFDRDANIAQDACRIQAKGAIRICDLFDRPLVISFWFTRGANCLLTQDAVDRAAAGYRGRVNFLLINVRDDPDEVQSIIAEHGWSIPVGYDRDGAVSNLYRVDLCPTVAFAYPGGTLAFAKAGLEHLSERQIAGDVKRLLRRSGARARRAISAR